MGNSSETQSNIFGEFKVRSECKCNNVYKKISKVTYDCCRIMLMPFHVVSNVFSKVRGFGRALVGKEPQWNAVHAFIELKYECSVCNMSGYITIDFGKGTGVRKRFGYYGNTSNFAKKMSKERSYLNYEIAKKEAKDLERESFSHTDYDMLGSNCQDFALQLYRRL